MAFFAPSIASREFLAIVAIFAVPVVLGLCDDLIHLRPRYKLAGQALLATLIVFVLDIRVTSLYGLFGVESLNPGVSYFLTLAVTIILTNSFNLIDGIDGLAGTFALVALVFFGFWFYFAGHSNYTTVCFALSGAIIAFLLLNWEPSRIFMGETGSLFIGLALAVFSIEFMNTNYSLASDAPARFGATIGTLLCVLIVPVTDTVRIIILRLSRGVSPFTPDKRHIHHCMVRLGMRHRITVSILCAAHVLFISAAVLLRDLGEWYVLTFAVTTSALLCGLLEFAISHFTYQKR